MEASPTPAMKTVPKQTDNQREDGDPGDCKGYCSRARRGAERGTSRGSEGFSLLCNDRLNRSAYLAGDPKRKG